jgi:hypothetical protein
VGTRLLSQTVAFFNGAKDEKYYWSCLGAIVDGCCNNFGMARWSCGATAVNTWSWRPTL